MHYFNIKRVFIYKMMSCGSTLQQNFLLGFFVRLSRYEGWNRPAISEDDFDVKKCPLPSRMLFQVVEPGEDRAEGRPPPQKTDESGFRGLFSSVDL